MNWAGRRVSVTVNGVHNDARLRFKVAISCSVEIEAEGGVALTGVGPDLFEALTRVRRELEGRGMMVVCQGARTNVFPSALQRQAVRGRRAYVLEFPPTATKPQVVDIFDPADPAEIGTVAEQLQCYSRWLSS